MAIAYEDVMLGFEVSPERRSCSAATNCARSRRSAPGSWRSRTSSASRPSIPSTSKRATGRAAPSGGRIPPLHGPLAPAEERAAPSVGWCEPRCGGAGEIASCNGPPHRHRRFLSNSGRHDDLESHSCSGSQRARLGEAGARRHSRSPASRTGRVDRRTPGKRTARCSLTRRGAVRRLRW